MTLVLTVLKATPSLNDFANLRRQPWRYRELRRTWHRHLTDALLEARVSARVSARAPLRWPRPPKEPVRVHIIRYAPVHQWLDADNLAGGLKPVLDGLKAHQLIADDDPQSIELVTEQAISFYSLPARWTEIRLSLDPPVLHEVHA